MGAHVPAGAWPGCTGGYRNNGIFDSGSGSTTDGPDQPPDGSRTAWSPVCQGTNRHRLLGYRWTGRGIANRRTSGRALPRADTGGVVNFNRYASGDVGGYRAIPYARVPVHSAKVGADALQDIERIRFLEVHREPDEVVFYDVNRAWTRAEAVTVMNAVADLPITFEQPCETLDDCLAVRRVTSHPMAIDERLDTLNDMTRIVSDRIAELINIKINRVGGLTRAARIRDLALAHGIGISVMPTGGTVLADTDAIQFAQTIPAPYRLRAWPCQDMITVDPAPGRGARVKDGLLAAPEAPGLGVAPDEQWLGEPVAFYSLNRT